MARLNELRPKSLAQYLEQVQALQSAARNVLWFRGSGEHDHTLVPSLYRHPKSTTPVQFQDLERQLIGRFRQRSIPYHDRDLSDEWDTIFFMQHYGTPTRLLDWTENSLTALHFALMTAKWDMNASQRVKYTTTAAVWVLDPFKWNQQALEHLSYKGGPLSTTDEQLKGYVPPLTSEILMKHPVAMYGAHNSARIVAQQGVFVIFGVNRTPMESLVRNGDFPPASLTRIVFPPSRIPAMRKALLDQGITESTVYPDLEGLSREMKRHYGFEV